MEAMNCTAFSYDVIARRNDGDIDEEEKKALGYLAHAMTFLGIAVQVRGRFRSNIDTSVTGRLGVAARTYSQSVRRRTVQSLSGLPTRAHPGNRSFSHVDIEGSALFPDRGTFAHRGGTETTAVR